MGCRPAATVLTNANGLTLYSFAPDTPATSKCSGSCAAYWPPVTGTTAAAPGLPGKVTTITRTDGSHQLTYNGHPLYTYIGDSAPGQARGNNLNLNSSKPNQAAAREPAPAGFRAVGLAAGGRAERGLRDCRPSG